MKPSLYLITPVLNEVLNMPDLTDTWAGLDDYFPDYNLKFILIDDGSDDGTGELATKLSEEKSIDFTLITHEANEGPGYAFGSGFEFLYNKLKLDDIVVTIEGDNTCRVDTLVKMIGRIIREDEDVAFASPLSYGGKVLNTKFHRRLTGHAASALTKIVLNISGIHTFSSFFRAYKSEVIVSLQKHYGPRILEFSGFECMIELLKKIVNLEYSITEVPMILDTSLRKGKSKLKVTKTVFRYFKLFYRSRKWRI